MISCLENAYQNKDPHQMSKQSLGLDENITAALSYLFGWISGLIIILIEKDNQYVRFHAMQSIVVFGALSLASIVVSIIPFLFAFIWAVVNLVAVVLWIVLMIKAYQREELVLPIATDITNDLLKKY